MGDRIDALVAAQSLAADPADHAATLRHLAKGKLTAHQRLEVLFDVGTFRETGTLRQHQADAFGLGQRRPSGEMGTRWP